MSLLLLLRSDAVVPPTPAPSVPTGVGGSMSLLHPRPHRQVQFEDNENDWALIVALLTL